MAHLVHVEDDYGLRVLGLDVLAGATFSVSASANLEVAGRVQHTQVSDWVPAESREKERTHKLQLTLSCSDPSVGRAVRSVNHQEGERATEVGL